MRDTAVTSKSQVWTTNGVFCTLNGTPCPLFVLFFFVFFFSRRILDRSQPGLLSGLLQGLLQLHSRWRELHLPR